jgi:hypothetical protein
MKLGGPLGWDTETYMDDVALQDDFLEDINAPTYNGFRDVLFYDVLEGLAKTHIVNRLLDEQMDEVCRERREHFEEKERLRLLQKDDESDSNVSYGEEVFDDDQPK